MNDNNPLVSVIIPTYNRAHLVGRTIQSILDQTYKNFELIIVNDGGADNSKEIISRYKDNRIKYFEKPNGGLSSARNFGIQEAQGKFIAFCDDDDIWLPGKLKVQINFINQKPETKICYTASSFVLDNGKEIIIKGKNCDTKDLLVKGQAILSALIASECFSKVKLFDENLPVCEDYDMWLRLSLHYPIYYIDKPLVKINMHGQNMTTNQKNISKYNIEVSKKNYHRCKEIKKLNVKDSRYIESAILFREGKYNFFDKKYLLALKFLIKSLILNPLNTRALFFIPLCFIGVNNFYRIIPIYEKIFNKNYFEFG